MYILRRVAKTQPGKAWQVANYLTKICRAYEENGRDKARVYIGGQGLPGTPSTVYAEWTQERIEPNKFSDLPPTVLADNTKMQEMLIDYQIEFYEIVTPEKLQDRNLS